MKLLFTILFSGLFLSVKAHCKLIFETDQSTGLTSRSTRYEEVGKLHGYGLVKLKMSQEVNNHSRIRLSIQISNKKTKCIGSDSRIVISTDNVIVPLKLAGQVGSDTQYDVNGVTSGLVC